MNWMKTCLLLGATCFVCVKSESSQFGLQNITQEEGSDIQLPGLILFDDPDDVEFTFDVKDFKTGTERKLNLTLSRKFLAEKNLTLEQVRKGWIEITNEGKQEFIIEGLRYELQLNMTTFFVYQDDEGKPSFALNFHHFEEMTMKDIEGDPTLVPMEPLSLKWKFPAKCDLRSMTVNVTGYSVEVKLNDFVVTSVDVIKDYEKHRKKIIHFRNEGLVITVVNPGTCKITFQHVAKTSDVSGYRDFLWSLSAVQAGRIVILASLRDGATFFRRLATIKLLQLGSLQAPYYFYRDSWINIFVKGGKVFQESLVPNLERFNTSGSPMVFSMDTQGMDSNPLFECSSWPTEERWNARKIFCSTNDGYSNLCSCENPFDFKDSENKKSATIFNSTSTTNSTGIIVILGNRTRHLFHMFQSLAPQPGVTKDLLLLVSDGQNENATRLAHILGLRILIHRPEGVNATRISRNLRFALYNGLQTFPNSSALILLEDDLLLSSDFYSFMNQLQPLFEMDKSVFCVSAFNHVSYPHTSSDPTLTYRVESYPAYGWMMPRYIVEEIVPKWLPSNFSHDWDYFVGSNFVRGNRECVVPDINRSYHWSTGGIHMTDSYASEILFLSRKFNKNPNVTLQSLQRLQKENYEDEFVSLLNASIPIKFETQDDLDKNISPGKVLSVFVSKKTYNDTSSFRLFGEELSIWNMDARDHHNHAWRFPYKNSTVIVVGVPMSKYSSYMPKDYIVLTGNKETDSEIVQGELFLRASLNMPLHSNFTNLPLFL